MTVKNINYVIDQDIITSRYTVNIAVEFLGVECRKIVNVDVIR